MCSSTPRLSTKRLTPETDRQTDIKCRLPISYQLMEVGVLLPSVAMIPSNHEDWHTAVMDLDLALYVNSVLHDQTDHAQQADGRECQFALDYLFQLLI